jgi:hypothetical protein
MKVTHLIDPIENDRRVPGVGEKVRVKGREGLYLVLRINKKAGIANLVPCGPGLHLVKRDIPVSLLQADYDYLPELFRWYVEAAPAR